MKTWTVAFVNYKTAVYLKWQLKILYEFNDPKEFEIIIVDNSKPFQKKELQELTEVYNEKWHNIKIVYNNPEDKIDSNQHASGLNIAVKMANSKYFLAEDPDFFFVIKNHLKFLEKFLKKGMVAVGAPYPYPVGFGHPEFPALYGAAHPLKLIKNLSCDADYSDEARNEFKRLFKNTKIVSAFDVGFKIRKSLSNDKDNSNFISFETRDIDDLVDKIGAHSWECITKAYWYDGKEIAYHLFRGSFTDKPNKAIDPNKNIDKKLIKVRNNFGKYFYNYVRLGRKPKIISLGCFKNLIKKMLHFIYHKEKCSNGKRKIRIFGMKVFSYKNKKKVLPPQPFRFPESALAHKYLDGLRGLEIGGSFHNAFGLNTLNVDYTDSVETKFKEKEKEMNGRSLKVDIVAWGDDLPFKDNTVDFVINAHVLEHFWDPIKALNEWMRVIKPGGYIFMIIPHKERTFDKDRPRTTLNELIVRHNHPEKDPHTNEHHSVWITEDFLELCRYLKFNVVEYQDIDDKVGNGFTIVIKK